MKLPEASKATLGEALSRTGLRSTKQREHIFAVLLDKRDHPTADEVYARARGAMNSISLATVYNCLETLVHCGLVRQVNIEREPSRYCPNLHEHAHFHDQRTGRVHDVDVPRDFIANLKRVLPTGYTIKHIDLSFHGVTPENKKSRKIPARPTSSTTKTSP